MKQKLELKMVEGELDDIFLVPSDEEET